MHKRPRHRRWSALRPKHFGQAENRTALPAISGAGSSRPMPQMRSPRSPRGWTCCAGLQPGHLAALHRTARSHGLLVIDQPATEDDHDRGARRASRPCDHLPTGRGGRHRPDGPCHHFCHPSSLSASVMRMIEIHPQTERQRQDRSASRAQERRRRASPPQLPGQTRPVPTSATPDTVRDEKALVHRVDSGDLDGEGTSDEEN